MRNYTVSKLLAAAVLGLLSIAAAGEQTGEAATRGKALAEKLDRRDLGYGDSRARLTMTIANRAGDTTVRELQVAILEVKDGGDKSLMTFDFPADVRGTALLTHPKLEGDDDQWLYLPSINRVKRISSRNKSGSFVGSEFSFEDLADKSVEDFTYKHLGSVECRLEIQEKDDIVIRPMTCEKLERVPRDEYSGYSRQVVTLEPSEYRILSIDYYDVRGDLLKRLVSERFRLFDGKYWRPLKVTMTNEQTGKSTILEYDSLVFGIGLNDRDFSRSALAR